MHLHTKTVRQGINKAYLKVNVKRADLDAFKEEATSYLNNLDQAEGKDEEHHKAYLRDFLKGTFYSKEDRLVNTSGNVDLGIYSGKTTSSNLEVIIEAKKPGNTREMIAKDNPNGKALHEALLYYFEEREAGNEDLKQVVITNYTELFLFDAQEIERNFYSKKSLVKTFNQWNTDKKISSNTQFMYDKFGEFIVESDANLNAVHVDLSKFKKKLAAPVLEEDDKKLIPLYKLFSPEHLVKKQFANDSNSLDKRFYNEFLHILGLKEVREGSTRLIRRLPEEERQRGSLIEIAMDTLQYDQHMNEVREAKVQYGENEADQLFGVALELVITWMNRVLFLKLMESQLLAYHNHDPKFKFLSYSIIDEYDELNKLFFRVLARRNEERPPKLQERYGHIPYLNSSLFDSTNLEKTTTQISGLDDKSTMDLHSRSVLKKGANQPEGSLNTLDYLLRFLEAYNFSAESSGGIQTEDKALINASVLGLIFEKINGYKDGSFFTPGFITEYMARETLRKSVLDKCNEAFDWDCSGFDELKRMMESLDLKKANEVINTITICDPAVGSGHFLVSSLNELIAIKAELKILCDHEGNRIPYLDIEVENDELAIEHEGELFEYKLNHKWKNGKVLRKPAGSDRQRVQVALFHEKKFLIENCLFGVDINPNSVKICRLRLWIELLKNAYYRSDEDYSELEVLPNIDINIKQGNSLVSRFELDEDLSSIFKKSDHSLEDYKQAVRSYRETRDRSEKQRLQQLIDDIKAEYSESLINNKPINRKLSDARAKYNALVNQADMFGKKASKKEIAKAKKKVAKLENQKTEEEAGAFYREAFEWRFEFPEVLDEDGKYRGFDVVIGNPPYVRQEALGDLKPYLKTHFDVYAGTADLYTYFIEQGVKLLRENGYFHYIVANKWMRANYGKPLRTWMQQRQITAITDFGDLPVFEEATTYPCLLEIKKADNPTVFKALEVESLPVEDFEVLEEVNGFEVDATKLSKEGWSLKPIEVQDLFGKVAESSIRLGEYTNDKILSGIKTGANDVFIIDDITRNKIINEDPKSEEVIKPVLGGSDIQKYLPPKIENYLLFIPWHFPLHEDSSITGASKVAEEEFKKEYPGAYNYLLSYKGKLSERNKSETGIRYEWYALQRCAATYFEEFEKPKLILPDISKRGNFTLDSKGEFYIQNSAYIIGKADKFLLGILNSNLIAFIYKGISSSYRGGYLRFINQYLEQIPIKKANTGDKNEIISIVNQILTAKKEEPEADTSQLEAEIDRLVYKLYGLSEEEIGIVEGSM